MCGYHSKIMEVKIKIVSPDSFFDLIFLELLNFLCDTI